MRAQLFALMGAVSACGRFGFDAQSGAPGDTPLPDTSDPAATAADFVAALTCETDLSIATVPTIDELQWLDLGGRQIVFAVHHVDSTHHEVHAHVLGVNAGQIVKVADVTSYAATDLKALGPARTSTGVLLLVYASASGTVHALGLDAAFGAATDMTIVGFDEAFVPYAKSTAAQMIVGLTTNGIVAYTVADNGATTSSALVVDTIADSPYHTSIAAYGADFIVGWTTSANTCKFVRLTAAGTITAGPLVIAGPGGCDYASAVAIGQTIVLGFVDPTGPAYSAVTDGLLATATGAQPLGAVGSDIQDLVDAGDHAIAAVRENLGDSRIVSIATTGAVTPLGADFGLTADSSDHQTASVVAGALLHARSEGGMLHVRKLCR